MRLFPKLAVTALLALAVAAQPLAAVDTRLTLLLDLDNDISSGCTIAGVQGVEQRVVTTVATTAGPDGAQVTRTEGFDCAAAQTFVDTAVRPVGLRPLGSGGLNVVETYWPRLAPLGSVVRLHVLADNDSGGSDRLSTADGQAGGAPILFGLATAAEIPTLSGWAMLLAALLLGAVGWRGLRRGEAGRARVLFALALTAGLAGAAWAVIGASDLDGSTLGEWPTASRVAYDPTATDDGDDVAALFVLRNDGAAPPRLDFRIDASLVFDLLTAVDDGYGTQVGTPLNQAAPGVLANDTLAGGGMLSYGAATGSEQTTIGAATPTSAGGTVVLQANGSFVYTPAAAFSGNDSFRYVLQNGSGAAAATVTITVSRLPQTIAFTSAAPASAKVGGATYGVTATATSALPVLFTIDPSAAAVCSIAGSTVSFLTVGTCVVNGNQAGDATYGPAPQVQQSFAVARGDQTITLTSTAPAGATVGGPTYVVTATATSGLPVVLTVDATASSVCSLAGSTVSFLSVGTCVLDANQGGDANWNPATQVQQSFAVGQGNQTIAFTSTPPAAEVNGPTYVVTATATSGLPVSFTVDASAATVCSISGATVSFLAQGTCVLDANQAGDTNWNPAPQAQQSFAVGLGNQTITITSTVPSSAQVAGPTYTVTATATSGLTVTFAIDATAASVCSLAGSTVSFVGAGTCVVNANQAGDGNWNPAPQVQQSFAVGRGDQTIGFTSSAPVGAKVGGPTYAVTATATSSLAVSFTIDASATSVCSIAGSTVSFLAAGTCVVDANQAGDANWNPAPQVQQSFVVGQGDQTISFTSTAPVAATVGGPTYTVTATATSGLPVTLTVDATAITICSLAGSTVSFLAVGTCVLDANQAGNVDWNPAPQVQQSFGVGKGSQTIAFTSTPPAGATVNGPTYNVTATASSGLPVTLTIDATAATVCSIAGSTVSFLGAGTCVIDANQPGDANWNAAPQAQQSFAVVKGDQTISFTSTAPLGAKVGGATYTVTATATSGLPVTLTIDATATAVCSLAGSTVSFLAVGTCVIDANQPGDANYNPAPQVQQSFAVAKGDQTISFTSAPPAAAKVAGATYTVTANATSGLPVTLTVDASATSVCVIAGSTVSFVGAGTCVLDGNQAGNADWNPAPQAQQSFAVAKGDQTISFTSSAPAGATALGSTYTVAATATSGLPVTFTVDAAASSVCSLAGATVSFLAGGTCVIDANQAGDANWNAAPQVQQSFPVAKASQTISFTSTAPANAKVTGPTYTVTASASSGLPVSLTIDASATAVCSLAGSTVSFLGAGTCVIDANQAGNATYGPAPQVQQSFLVTKNDQTIAFTSTAPLAAAPGGPTYTVTATATSGLAVVFSIDASATGVCSVAGATVSFTAGGTCVVNANQAGNFAYNPAPQVQQSFHVNFPPQLTTNPVGYSTPGNTQLHVAGATLPGVASWADASGLLAKSGATDPDSGPGALAVVATSGTTSNGGTFNVTAGAGAFTYVPAAGFVGTDSFSYGVTDSLSTTTGTMNVTVGPRVWYVRDVVDASNPAAGDTGRSTNPFDSIAELQATTTNANDILYVFEGNSGTTPFNLPATLTLLDGQKLWGQGIALDVPGFGTSLVAAANKPRLQTTGASVSVVSVLATAGNRSNVEIRGVDLEATGTTANAIQVSSSGANVVGVTISDDAIRGATNRAIDLVDGSSAAFAATVQNNTIANALAGVVGRAASGGTTTVGVTSNAIAVATAGVDLRTSGAGAGAFNVAVASNTIAATGAAGNGITIDGSASGTTTVTAFAGNAISGTTTGAGISVNTVIFDQTPGGAVQQVAGGNTAIGQAGDPVGDVGMSLANAQGNLFFTDLDVYAALSGLTANGTGGGLTLGVTAKGSGGTSVISAAGGAGVSVSNATIDLQLDDLDSTTSGAGVSLTSVGGTFSTDADASISKTSGAGTAFSVASSASGTSVTYAGTMNVTSGAGVSLTNNSGSTISFSGPLTLSTGASSAFTATGGGTVTATDTTSTLSTSSAIALNVANTSIGVGGLRFRSVAAGAGGSPANGIVLNATGTSGGLTVSGTGVAGSGGTIQNTTGDGVSLTDTHNVSLSWMSFTNVADSVTNNATCDLDTATGCSAAVDMQGGTSNVTLDRLLIDGDDGIDGAGGANPAGQIGISGNGVNGLSVTNTTIKNVGESNDESAVLLTDPQGAVSFDSVTITDPSEYGIRIYKSANTALNLKLTGVTVQDSISTFGEAGFSIRMDGGSANVLISGSTFTNTDGPGVDGQAINSAVLNLTLQGSTFTNNLALPMAVNFVTDNSAQGFVKIANNTMNDCTVEANCSVAIDLDANRTSTLHATVTNNQIPSGAGIGTGLEFLVGDGSTGRAEVRDNTVTVNSGEIGMTFGARSEGFGGSNGRLDVIFEGNTINGVQSGGLFNPGVQFLAGSSTGSHDQDLCVNTATAAGAGGNTINGTISAGLTPRFEVTQRTGTTFMLQGFSGTGTSTASVASFFDTNNNAGTLEPTFVRPAGGTAIVNYTTATCNTPTTPILPP